MNWNGDEKRAREKGERGERESGSKKEKERKNSLFTSVVVWGERAIYAFSLNSVASLSINNLLIISRNHHHHHLYLLL